MLAEEIVARAAVCIDNARRYTREHATALTLQHSLLQRRQPDQPAVEVATRYLPAHSGVAVGGDWFDVIRLSGSRVGLVVGDVVGHGIHAAATMGRLRTAVRTLADIDLEPEELLTRLDDVVTRLADEEEQATDGSAADLSATCLYAVYDPVSRCCTLARAGHPVPAIVDPDGTAEFLDLPAGPPLGLGGLPFEETEIRLPEGSLLVLYTDGLIESRQRDIDAGLDAMRKVLGDVHVRPDGPAAAALEPICDAWSARCCPSGPRTTPPCWWPGPGRWPPTGSSPGTCPPSPRWWPRPGPGPCASSPPGAWRSSPSSPSCWSASWSPTPSGTPSRPSSSG